MECDLLVFTQHQACNLLNNGFNSYDFLFLI